MDFLRMTGRRYGMERYSRREALRLRQLSEVCRFGMKEEKKWAMEIESQCSGASDGYNFEVWMVNTRDRDPAEQWVHTTG